MEDLQRTEMAFPVATVDGYTQYGMTLRDYFAAKAPVDIPHWFETNYNEIGECPACVVDAELNDNPWPACENQNEINAWHEKAMKIRYFQWRYSYADSMLEARKA